jgi:hypothetical protein
MNGGYATNKVAMLHQRIEEKESVMLQLEFKGICERGNYVLFPISVGDFRLYTIKFSTSPVSSMYESVDEAIEEFIKLTH